jgi:putative acetyltransferase
VELVKFYLSRDSRGKGIGKDLMEKCIHSAREFGYTKIYLESLPQFSRAVTMYEKLGFITLDHPLGESGHRTCHIWMLKELL